jgi:uncharacterized protein (TIGR02246 family)
MLTGIAAGVGHKSSRPLPQAAPIVALQDARSSPAETRRMLRLAAALAFSLLATPALAVEVVGQLSEADRLQVEAAAIAADANWNSRNADGLAAMYTDDATLLIGGRGPALTGPEAVQAYFTTSFARTPPSMHHTTLVDRIVVLAPDLVLADTRVALDEAAPDGSLRRVRDFNTVTVLGRRNGEWKFQSVRAYPVAATAAASTASQK